MEKREYEIEEDDAEEIDLLELISDLWKAAKKFFWLVLLLALIGGGGAFLWRWRSYSPVYKASTSFVVQVSASYTGTGSDKKTVQQLRKTFPYIVKSGGLNYMVAKDLGVDRVTSNITADVLEDTTLFTISVTDPDPETAYDVLQSVMNNYPKIAEYIIGPTYWTIVDESGIPENPANSPAYVKTVGTGVLAGVMVSLVFLVIYVRTRKTVRGSDDLKQLTSARFLGGIPQMDVKKRSKTSDVVMMIDQPNAGNYFIESIRTIRSRMESELEKNKAKVIVVTSAAMGEGKTTAAINIAKALSKKETKVILVDGNIRMPYLAKSMGLEMPEKGLFEVLQGKAGLEDVILMPEDNLTVLPSVTPVGDQSVSWIRSNQMKILMGQLREQFDLIIIDTAACGVYSDAMGYAECADSTIMVVRQDYSLYKQVVSAMETVNDAGMPLMGYILNGDMGGSGGYGYGRYGYGKYGYRRYGYGKYGYGHYGYGSKKSSDKFKDEENDK